MKKALVTGISGQELIDDVFRHKTGVAGCYNSAEKVPAKLVFRTATVYGIEQNIGVND